MSRKIELSPRGIEVTTHGKPPLTTKEKMARTGLALLAVVTGGVLVRQAMANDKKAESSVIAPGTPTTEFNATSPNPLTDAQDFIKAKEPSDQGSYNEEQHLVHVIDAQTKGRPIAVGQKLTLPIDNRPKQ